MVELFDYQKEYLSGLPKNVIMTASTGVGKGQMSLAHYKQYSYPQPLLIIVPAAKARTDDWERELEMAGLSNLPHQVVSYDKFAKAPRDYFPTKDFAVICDEIHFAKNPTTKRGRATILASRLASQFIGLSATPMGNGWKDAKTYAIIFGIVKNKTEFQNRFEIIDRSRGFPLYLGYREEPFLKNFWSRVSRPLERTMTSKSIPVRIALTPARLKRYKKTLYDRITPEGEVLDSAPKLFAYSRQSLARDRMAALESVLDGTDEHVVVFYNYDSEREAILEVLEKYDVEIYEQSGHGSKLPPRETWESMKRSVTLAQYQSASAAIELQYASVTVFYSPSYSYTDFQQAKGRTRRVGQLKTPLYYCFRVDDTIDVQVWRALSNKRDFDVTVVKGI